MTINDHLRDQIDVATEAGKASYREHHRTVTNMLEVIDTLWANSNDLARRLAEAHQHLNTVCHQRDDEAEENRNLRDEVERLTTEIEAMRAAVTV